MVRVPSFFVIFANWSVTSVPSLVIITSVTLLFPVFVSATFVAAPFTVTVAVNPSGSPVTVAALFVSVLPS